MVWGSIVLSKSNAESFRLHSTLKITCQRLQNTLYRKSSNSAGVIFPECSFHMALPPRPLAEDPNISGVVCLDACLTCTHNPKAPKQSPKLHQAHVNFPETATTILAEIVTNLNSLEHFLGNNLGNHYKKIHQKISLHCCHWRVPVCKETSQGICFVSDFMQFLQD